MEDNIIAAYKSLKREKESLALLYKNVASLFPSIMASLEQVLMY